MIIFEEKIRELVGLMPNLVDANGSSFPIRYDWGTQDVLNKWLLLPESVSKYPLIWLVNAASSEDTVRKTITRKSRFIIATRSVKKNEFNQYQYQTDYSKILLPVYENFKTVLERSGITKIIENKIDTNFLPNYSEKDNGKGLIDTWNALTVDLNIELKTDRCVIKNIKF